MRTKELIITDMLPAYFLFDYAIMGSFALTTKTQRFILDEYATTLEEVTDTPGHHFSTICKDIRFPKKPGTDASLSYPYKSIPSKHPYCFYVDVYHAYSQITEIMGIDCSYREGRYMAFGTTPLHPIFEDSKIMRALLVGGTGKESTLTEWKNHDIVTRRFYNRNYAPCLSGAIFGVLHAIAGLIEPYTLYSHTDGHIVRSGDLSRVCKLLEERGIRYTIKGEGITQIYGAGSYRVGSLATRNKAFQRSPVSNICANHSHWWLTQWERGKAYRG